VRSFWFDVYYGGDESARDIEIHFDSLVVSPERVGCDGLWDGTFADDDGSTFEGDIEWLATTGITKGCGGISFCPRDPVTRGQMAAFLTRGLDLTAGGGDTFTDDDASEFEEEIERLFAAGITTGCGGTRFCPGSNVTRGQMAAFLARAFDLPTTEADYFADDAASIFESEINRLAASGITTGCSVTAFCPDDLVTREQMAAFLHRSPLAGS
jgi:hypothetical protein